MFWGGRGGLVRVFKSFKRKWFFLFGGFGKEGGEYWGFLVVVAFGGGEEDGGGMVDERAQCANAISVF